MVFELLVRRLLERPLPFLLQLPSVSSSCWSGYKPPSDWLAGQTAKQAQTRTFTARFIDGFTLTSVYEKVVTWSSISDTRGDMTKVMELDRLAYM